MVELLVANGAIVDFLDVKDGYSALMIAAYMGNIQVVERLLAMGAEVNLETRVVRDRVEQWLNGAGIARLSCCWSIMVQNSFRASRFLSSFLGGSLAIQCSAEGSRFELSRDLPPTTHSLKYRAGTKPLCERNACA